MENADYMIYAGNKNVTSYCFSCGEDFEGCGDNCTPCEDKLDAAWAAEAEGRNWYERGYGNE